MDNTRLMVQLLAFLFLFLVVMFAAALKVIGRFRARALAPSGEHPREERQEGESSPRTQPGRRQAPWPALVTTAAGAVKVSVHDANPAGAFVTCPRPLAVGANLTIKIVTPRDDPLELEARVIWNNRNVPVGRIVRRGMKVRFLHLSADDRRRLASLAAGPPED